MMAPILPRRLRKLTCFVLSSSTIFLLFVHVSQDRSVSGSGRNNFQKIPLDLEQDAAKITQPIRLHLMTNKSAQDALKNKSSELHVNPEDSEDAPKQGPSIISQSEELHHLAEDRSKYCDKECMRFKNLLKTWPSDKPRAAICLLTKSSRLSFLISTLISVDKYFNDKFNYPIIIFHEEEFMNVQNTVRSLTRSSVFFQKVNFTIPKFLKEPVALNIPCMSHISYRHMCRFYAKTFFEEATIRELELYWRLDDDSLLLSPVKYDVFKYMKDNSLQYGYSWRHLDAYSCVEGLWEATRTYIEQNNLATYFFNTWKRPWLYYNNFEISQTKTWFSERYKKYIEYLDHLGGIYYHRWGDAPIRGIAVSMFIPKTETHCFTDIGYQHRTYIHNVSDTCGP